jgi:hypothetical protein
MLRIANAPEKGAEILTALQADWNTAPLGPFPDRAILEMVQDSDPPLGRDGLPVDP